jgi:hypothetical protein
VPPEIMGIGPIEAIPKVLKQAGLTLAQIWTGSSSTRPSPRSRSP